MRARCACPLAADARLVMVTNPPQHPKGDFVLDGERLVAGNRANVDLQRYWYFSAPALFEGCTAGQFPLLPLLKRAIAAGRLQGQHHTGQWLDIGTPDRLAALNRKLARPPHQG